MIGLNRMPSVPIKGLHRVKVKGNTYLYAWRGGPRLYAEEGTPEFFREYKQAVEEARQPARGTLHGLIAQFKRSAEYKALSRKSRAEYARHLDRIAQRFGDAPLAVFDDRRIKGRIREWRDSMAKQPRTADYAIATLKRLLSFGTANGEITHNMAKGFKALHKADRSDIVWTQEDLDVLNQQLSPAVQNAVSLACFTGLRLGDLIALPWSADQGTHIEWITSKRDRAVIIPLPKNARALLDSIPRVGPIILTNTKRRPWTTSGLSTVFQRAKKEAGIDKRWHDFRGNAATELCLAGFDDREVSEIVGWSPERVAAIRRKYVDRNRLITAAIVRLERNETGAKAVKRGVKRQSQKGAK